MSIVKRPVVYLILIMLAIVAITFTVQPNEAPPTQAPETDTSVDAPSDIQATLFVQEQTYPFELSRDTSVLEAMRKIDQEQEAFSFSGSESAYGYFVEEINGKKNDTSASDYWSLYVNGTLSQTGVSDTRINDGDVIEWRYEHVGF